MLESAKLIAFIPTRDPQAAKQFYEHTLKLQFVSDDGFALVFDAAGTMVRIANVSGVTGFRPAPFTILGWHVADVDLAVKKLAASGVVFERFAGLDQSPAGIWTSPSGARIAWFKDPDGNVLSISGT